jgi:hypothetical protein
MAFVDASIGNVVLSLPPLALFAVAQKQLRAA